MKRFILLSILIVFLIPVIKAQSDIPQEQLHLTDVCIMYEYKWPVRVDMQWVVEMKKIEK